MKASFSRVVIYIVLLIASFFYLFPLYTAMNTSLKSDEEMISGPVQPVKYPTLVNFVRAFSIIKRSMWNSIIITVFSTIFSAFLGAMSGFGFSRLKFRGSNLLLLIIVLGFYVPPQAVLIPLVRFMGRVGLYNTLAGLILTHTAYGMPITTLLFKNYFDTLPVEVIESARIDGCSNIGAFFRIALPLSLPSFAVVAIFQFTNIWNEFLYGLTLTQGRESQPLTVAVANLKGTTVASWNVQMAGVLASVLPVLIIYLFLSRLIIKGLLMGSVKG